MPKLNVYVIKYMVNYYCKSSWYKIGNTKWNFKLNLVINIKYRNNDYHILVIILIPPKKSLCYSFFGDSLFSTHPPIHFFCLKSSCLYCLDPSSQSLGVAFLDNLNTSYLLLFYDTQFNCISLSIFLVCITVITWHICPTLEL